MPIETERTHKRNADIYDQYKSIYKTKFLRHEKILNILADKFYLEESTIQKIVLNEGKKRKTENGK